jgi:16S rRNA (adenine(1408)-N(1))-methyltransferase
METIRGKTSLNLNGNEFKDRLANYNHITLDLGTGDGRFVRTLAESHTERFVIGVDACRENLREHSRTTLPNMLFVIACALELPCEFEDLFSQVTINFPWGSLLEGLLTCDPRLMHGLSLVSQPNTQIEIHLNGGALAEAGSNLSSGAGIIYENLSRCGWDLKPPHPMDQDVLKRFPTTWARRLAHGRDPHGMILRGRRAYDLMLRTCSND